MYIGIDIGTGSARACLIDAQGDIKAVASHPILRFSSKQDHINQSSVDIWNAICYCTKTVLADSSTSGSEILGIAFDATCSLIATRGPASDETLAVGPDFTNKVEDVILWMDHRAGKETQKIKETKHPLLKYVGGQMSIEMEIPKIMWLKEHMPAQDFNDAHFYDLSDWLTMHATGVDARSFCSVACKQGYVPLGVDNSTTGWNAEFLNSIGLKSLVDNDFAKMGGVADKNGIYHSAGEYVGHLNERSAFELGLSTNCVVGSGVIDAYSGWIGTVAAKTSEIPEVPVSSRLAAVAGTSTCHIVQSQDPVFVPGVWGPYRDVLVPGMWCAEGGQSTTGELINFVLTTHPAYNELELLAKDRQKNKFELLNELLFDMQKQANLPTVYHLTKDLFLYGDFYGNRSPIADPNMRGSITGLNMDATIQDLAKKYLAVLEFICQQQRQIIEALNSKGHQITTIFLSGGQCRNPILTELMATSAGMPVVMPHYIDAAVVLGTAMLAAKAAHKDLSLWDVMTKFSKNGTVIMPNKNKQLVSLLNAKYEILLDQADRQKEYRQKVADALK